MVAVAGAGVGRDAVAGHPLRARVAQELRARVTAVAAAGGVCVAAGLVLAPARVWPGVLIASLFLVGLGLTGLFFVALQYATGAHWGVALRRVPEAMTTVLPVAAAGLAAVFLARPQLYAWSAGFGDHVDGAHAFKAFWLSRPFFLVRAALYLAAWIAFANAIVRNSRLQDTDGDVAHTRRNVRLSIGFLPVFAVTASLAAFDWIMSLEPHWQSTIFGVYVFAGMFTSGLAAIIVLVVLLQDLGPRGAGPLHGVVTDEHVHDLGKLLFAFCTFWMYIWFSQYMLIWYANIPEETVYYVARLHGLWAPLFVLNVVLNWVVPFVVLLSRGSKRASKVLVKVALTVLVGRWLDLYLMVTPPLAGATPIFSLWEIGPVVLAAAAFIVLVLRALTMALVVPVRDPLLTESLHHHQ